jgi:hypothetical protein
MTSDRPRYDALTLDTQVIQSNGEAARGGRTIARYDAAGDPLRGDRPINGSTRSANGRDVPDSVWTLPAPVTRFLTTGIWTLPPFLWTLPAGNLPTST